MADPKIPEMVERVGNAVREAFILQKIDPWGGIDFGGVNPPVDWTAIGRAAIAAMREPTWEIAKAGDKASLAEGAHDCEVPMQDIWRAMIDAALKE